MARLEPTFGKYIRACRLGWYRAYRHGAWIRISPSKNGLAVDLHPLDQLVPSEHKGTYYVLAEGTHEAPADVLSGLSWLQPVRRVKRGFRVVVDDDGNILMAAGEALRD